MRSTHLKQSTSLEESSGSSSKVGIDYDFSCDNNCLALIAASYAINCDISGDINLDINCDIDLHIFGSRNKTQGCHGCPLVTEEHIL